MRAFLGLYPSISVINSFKEIEHKLIGFRKYLRFVESEKIHITLKFLGNDIPGKKINIIMRRLRVTLSGVKAFNLKLKEARFGFPGQRWPRILYVSTFKCEGMDKLYKNVSQVLLDQNLELFLEQDHVAEPLFHITIARVCKRLNARVIQDIRRKIKLVDIWEGFRVDGLLLIQSQLTKQGPRYKTLSKFDFS